MAKKDKEHYEIEKVFQANEAEVEEKIGKGMKEVGMIGLILLLYVVLFIVAFLLLKKVFLAGIILMIVLILGGIIALGIYIEKMAKKKKKK